MDSKNVENISNIQNTANISEREPMAALGTPALEINASEECSSKKNCSQMEIEATNNESIQETKDNTNNEMVNQEKELSKENTDEVATPETDNCTKIVDQSSTLMENETAATNEDSKQFNSATTTPSIAAQTQIKQEPFDDTLNLKATKSFATVEVKSEQNKRHLVGEKNFVTRSSLGLLAQYDSDSEQDETEKGNEDEVVEVPIEGNKDYRNKVVEIDSESESESSSSDSDVEYIAKLRKEIEKRIDLEDEEDADEDDDDDDETAGGKNKKKKAQNSMKVKGELGLEDLPPIEDLHITVPEEECIILGKVHSIVDQLLLVSALPDSTLYDLDTVLFLDKGKRVLGTVFDVLGQVADPLYCIRFNSQQDIEEKSIKVGDAVYVAPKTEHTQFVILSSLMKMRGSDASWENDIEPPPRYIDYSDDEQEREARQRLRNKDRSANKDYEDHDEAAKRVRDDHDETASVSSVASTIEQTQPAYSQRGRRFNRVNAHRGAHDAIRPRFNNQRSPQQMPRNPNAGSWHSNYHRPSYNSYNRPHMPPMPMPMNPTFSPFPHYPHFTPNMPPPPMNNPTMYVPNPYAMRPPQLTTQIPPPPIKMRSPSPPPPGID